MLNLPLICLDGELIPFENAQVHILSPAMKYGLCVFEGIRAYEGRDNLHIFRLDEHLERLKMSAKVMRFETVPTPTDMSSALIKLLTSNDVHGDVHIRLQVWVDGLDGPIASTAPIRWAIAAVPSSSRLDAPKEISIAISSWARPSSNMLPAQVKATANYMVSRLAALQARAGGYDNAILLNSLGHVAEAPATSLFMVRNNKIFTPALSDNILASITRATLMSLIRDDFKLPILEQHIVSSELYCADEIFLCGTAHEIQAVTSVDGCKIGTGKTGPITQNLFKKYSETVRAYDSARAQWRTPVYD